MSKNISLRYYFIRLFLLTMTFVGLAELLVNVIYIQCISPILNQIFHLDKLLETQTLSNLLSLSVEGFFWNLLNGIFSALPQMISEPISKYIQTRTDESIFMRFLHMHGSLTPLETRLYTLSLISIFFLLICLWIMPFIVASIVFSILVSKKVKEVNEEALQKQKEYERQKYLLLSDMAHDLKTPITTISGYAEALLQNEVADKNKDFYLQAIQRKALQMNDVITLMFEYVRLDSAGFTLHQTTENYSELIRGCIAALYTDFEKKHFELELLFPEADIYAYVDKLHMERAITNILVNAFKHNPDYTKVTVCLRHNAKQIVLDIYDTGVTISSDIVATIFEPFVQGDSARTSKSGTGLGLSITKKVVEMHKGTLTLFQPEDCTTYTKVFEITLPTPTLFI